MARDSTSRKSTERSSARNKGQTRSYIIIAAFCLVISGSVFAGMEYGVRQSPRYHTQSAMIIYMINNFKIEQDSDSITSDIKKIYLDTDVFRYQYDVSSAKVERVTRPIEDLRGRPLPRQISDVDVEAARRFYQQIVPAVGSVAAATGLATTVRRLETFLRPVTGFQRVVSFVLITALGATGGLVGYYITYDPVETFDPDAARVALEDPRNWFTLALTVTLCKSVTLNDELRRESILPQDAEVNPTARGQQVAKCMAMLNEVRGRS